MMTNPVLYKCIISFALRKQSVENGCYILFLTYNSADLNYLKNVPIALWNNQEFELLRFQIGDTDSRDYDVDELIADAIWFDQMKNEWSKSIHASQSEDVRVEKRRFYPRSLVADEHGFGGERFLNGIAGKVTGNILSIGRGLDYKGEDEPADKYEVTVTWDDKKSLSCIETNVRHLF